MINIPVLVTSLQVYSHLTETQHVSELRVCVRAQLLPRFISVPRPDFLFSD